MKGTKRSKISSSIRPVSSYFPTLSQHGNTIQNQSCGAEETYTNVDGTSSTTQQQSPAQQQDNPDTIVVNPEVHNNSTEYENGSVDLNPEDIVADPGLRKPIEELDVNVRDAARREYLVIGPCQPVGHKFPSKLIAKQNRRFQEKWFKRYDWLEYSVAKDATFCFYCFLFKQLCAEFFWYRIIYKSWF
jgi:hypothetical protein